MKPDDKDKLNKCLEILDSTDLGLALVWLWTWSTILGLLEEEDWHATVTKEQMWEHLCEAVAAGQGFSLEWGTEQHYEEVLTWMLSRDYLVTPEEEGDE